MSRDIWFGLSLIGLAAAVLSFFSLWELATACFVPIYLAWMYPITMDVGAAVTCRIWLSKKASKETENLARVLTLGLLALTIIGNGAWHGMLANGIIPPWWAAVILTSIPPSVLGATVHLAVLANRTRDAEPSHSPMHNGEVSRDSDGWEWISNGSKMKLNRISR